MNFPHRTSFPTDSDSRSRAYPPSHRLHYTWEYRRFFAGNEVFKTSAGVLFRISNELGHYRLGVTIKARGRAADRNRIKRKLREWFRHHEKELGSFDYNVVISGSRKIEFPYPDRLIEALDREFLYALSARRRA